MEQEEEGEGEGEPEIGGFEEGGLRFYSVAMNQRLKVPVASSPTSGVSL